MRQKSVLWVALAATLWGTTGSVAFFLQPSFSPLAIGAATMGGGGLILAILGGRATREVWRDASVRSALVMGSLGALVYSLAFYTGMAYAGISLGNVIALGLGPLVAACAEWLFERNRPSPWWWGAVGGALVGVGLMTSSEVTLGGDRAANLPWGIAAALVAGVAYGIFTSALSRILRAGHSPRASTGAMFGAASPLLLGVLFFAGPDVMEGLTQAGPIAYLILGPMVISYLAIGRALRQLSASSVTLVSLLEPVVATVLAFSLVGERVGLAGWWGITLVVCSLSLVSLGERSKN